MMCRTHWYQVPPALRTEIWRLWKTEPLSENYFAARDAAIAAVVDRGSDATL